MYLLKINSYKVFRFTLAIGKRYTVQTLCFNKQFGCCIVTFFPEFDENHNEKLMVKKGIHLPIMIPILTKNKLAFSCCQKISQHNMTANM